MDNYTAFNDVEKFQCRICFDDTEEKLITPCKCSGTSQYVHMSCLQKWRNSQYLTRDVSKCEICNYTFKIVKKTPFWFFRLGFEENRNPLDLSLRWTLLSSLIVVLSDIIVTPMDTNNKIIKPIISNTTNINSVTNSNAHMIMYSFYWIFIALVYIGTGILCAHYYNRYELDDYKKIYSKKLLLSIFSLFIINCIMIYFNYYYVSIFTNLLINFLIVKSHHLGIYIVNLTSLDLILDYVDSSRENSNTLDV